MRFRIYVGEIWMSINKDMILDMVKSYLQENSLTYDQFGEIFKFLSKKEQYKVTDILAENNIILTDEKIVVDIGNDELSIEDKIHKKTSNVFTDEESYEEVYTSKNIKQTNEVLCALIQEGNQLARQNICIKNRRLVDKYICKYEGVYGSRLTFDDLEQIGMIGLLKAAERFDISLGFAFSTYATWWIKQAMSRASTDEGFMIRIPVHEMEFIMKVSRLDSKYSMQGLDFVGRVDAIEQELNCSREKIQESLAYRSRYLSCSSLDIPVGEEQETELKEFIMDPRGDLAGEPAVNHIYHDTVMKVLATLQSREKDIIVLRYGLNGEEPETLEEIGKKYHVTRERIRQIEAKAIRKLRHPSRSNILREDDYERNKGRKHDQSHQRKTKQLTKKTSKKKDS